MSDKLNRRKFLGTVGAAVAIDAAANTVYAGRRQKPIKVRIVGIACSPRKGKTTADSLKVCLEAAAAVDPKIGVELIELAEMKIDGALAAGLPLAPSQKDDFGKLIPKLSDPKVRGIIIGTPVYFGNMTSLCKAFLDRCIAFRKNNFALSNKVAGVLAVGGARNGGQELTIQSVQAALLCQEMIIVGDAKPGARIGATIWNDGNGEVTSDEFGMATARNLGRRVAEVALQLTTIVK
ncbi:MAG: flavodoxin family protein [Planctomycetota bacterium]|jgi:multimeric flavodoxin WrbA